MPIILEIANQLGSALSYTGTRAILKHHHQQQHYLYLVQDDYEYILIC